MGFAGFVGFGAHGTCSQPSGAGRDVDQRRHQDI